ncbi:MAG: nucleoside deaminase [Pseudomonadota bacterium]
MAPATNHRRIVVTPADALSEQQRRRDERYMEMAIAALEGGNGPPFGAVIVDHQTDQVKCSGANRGGHNRLYHGEIDAIINCGNEHPEIDWTRLTLYTTGEPCPMCMSAIVWNRIPRVVYATSIRTLTDIGFPQFTLDSPTVASAAPFYSGEIVSGVLAKRTDPMFKAWLASR